MKTLIFIKSIIVVALFSLFVFISGCSGGSQIPPEVCNYGELVCSTGNYVCENFEIPDPICTYFNLACINLSVLCNSEPGSNEYNTALKSLNDLNVKVSEWMNKNTGQISRE